MASQGPQDWPPVAAAPFTLKDLGYFQATVSGTAQTIAQLAAAQTPPFSLAGVVTGDANSPSRMVLISVESEAIRWRSDGNAPTATVGNPVAAAAAFDFTGDASAIQFIAQTGSAILNLNFFK